MKLFNRVPWERQKKEPDQSWPAVIWVANIAFVVIGAAVLGTIWWIGETFGIQGLLWTLGAMFVYIIAWRVFTGEWPD